ESKYNRYTISKINEVAINAKTANWKAIVMFLILQFTNKKNYTI
ncbi:putative Hooker'S evening primr, partial [Quillaja saponaria]